MSWPALFYPHQVTVKNHLGAGGMGPGYAAARSLAAEVKDRQQLVRGTDGREVVSSTQVTVPLAADVPLESLVTVWAGPPAQREARVLAVARDDNRDTPLDSFLVLYLE